MMLSSIRRDAAGAANWLLLLVLSAGCSIPAKEKLLEVTGATYRIPSDHLSGFLSAEESGGPYARVRRADGPFLLIYSLDIRYPNEQGGDVPTIPYINYAPFKKIAVVRTNAGIIVCDEDASRYQCGMRIADAGIPWSILFHLSDIPRAKKLKDQAMLILSQYRA